MGRVLIAASLALAAATAAQMGGCARQAPVTAGSCIKQCILDTVTSPPVVRRQLEK